MFARLVRFTIIVLTITAIGWYLLYRNQQFLPLDKLPTLVKQAVQLPDEISADKNVLGLATKNLDVNKLKINQKSVGLDLDHSVQAFKTANDFLQHVIKTDKKDSSNITDRALKYGSYVYCKQVVKQWETTVTKSPTKK